MIRKYYKLENKSLYAYAFDKNNSNEQHKDAKVKYYPTY